jgi:dTDP-4-dehydrorhamnose reductase
MLRLGRERDKLSVVSDQIGSPTYATDLSEAILEIIKNEELKEASQTTQIYHYSNDGEISWHEFSKEIFQLAKIECKISPITTDKYPTSAKRPKSALMNKDKISHKFGIKIPFWKKSLNTCITILKG